MRDQACRWRLEVADQRVRGTTQRVPLVVFREEEQAHLLPWDGEPYDVADWRTATSDLTPLLKRLKLGCVLATLPERLALARRDQCRLELHLQHAGFEEVRRLEDFDWSAQVTLDRCILDAVFPLSFQGRTRPPRARPLRRPRRRGEVLPGSGPVRTKYRTPMLCSEGYTAVRAGHSVRFIRADDFFRAMAQAGVDHTAEKTFRSFLAPDLLIMDDLGLHRLNAQQSADLYELIIGRHRRSSFAITSNRAVAGTLWVGCPSSMIPSWATAPWTACGYPLGGKLPDRLYSGRFYCHRNRSDEEVRKGVHEVPEEVRSLWERCQQVRRERARPGRHSPPCRQQRAYPLTGILVCNGCGEPFHGITCHSHGSSFGRMVHSWHRCSVRPLSVGAPRIERELAAKVLACLHLDDGWKEAVLKPWPAKGHSPTTPQS